LIGVLRLQSGAATLRSRRKQLGRCRAERGKPFGEFKSLAVDSRLR
jgi:hypothetical protein